MVSYTFICATEECEAAQYAIEVGYSSIAEYDRKGEPDCPLCGEHLKRAFFDAPAISTGWVGSAGDQARPATCGSIKKEKPESITLDELLEKASE